MRTAPGPGLAGIVIPLRSFRESKRRLANVLDDDAREDLCRDLAERVLTAAGSAPVAVITSDPAVAAWARAAACTVLADPGSLDAAAATGCTWARDAGCDRVVVAHADLPLVTSFAPVLGDGTAPVAVIVPDHRDDGTPVISIPATTRFAFAYGPGSAARHIAAAGACGLAVRIVRDPDLAFDVDIADDLAALGRRPVPP